MVQDVVDADRTDQATLRVSVGELATRDFIRDQLSRLTPADVEHEERKKDKKKRDRSAETPNVGSSSPPSA